MGADGYAGADAERAESVPVAHLFFYLIKERDDVDGIFIEFFSAFRRGDMPADPVEQAYSVIFFQFLYGKADRGLGKMQFLRAFVMLFF